MFQKAIMKLHAMGLEGPLTEKMFLESLDYDNPDDVLYVSMQNPLCSRLGCRLPKTEEEKKGHPVFGKFYVTSNLMKKAVAEQEALKKEGVYNFYSGPYSQMLLSLIESDRKGGIKLSKLPEAIGSHPKYFDPREGESAFYAYNGWYVESQPAERGISALFYNLWMPPFFGYAKK